jgi:hypothetical protein
MNRGLRSCWQRFVFMACLAGTPLCAVAQDDPPEPDPSVADASVPTIDPARTLLVGDPGTVAELFEATNLMVDVARLDLAQLYLAKLMQQTLDDDTLLALRLKNGAAPFLKLARIPQLDPHGAKLLDLTNQALLRQASNAEHINLLVGQLDQEDEYAVPAREELISLGPGVVPALLKILADPADATKHEAVREILLLMRDRAIPPLMGALTAPDDLRDLKRQVISVLGLLEARAAVPFLWHVAHRDNTELGFTARSALARILKLDTEAVDRLATDGATRKLLEAAHEHFRLSYDWKTDAAGKVTLWLWSPRSGTVVERKLTPTEASDILGLRLAAEALQLAPELRAAQVAYLAALFVEDSRRAGFDQPLPEGPGTAHDTALSTGADVALDVIGEALRNERPFVAVAALQVFSQIGTLAQLKLAGPEKSPIATALDYPDPRVQFAAASAILQIDPANSFRGAPRVVEILKRALATDGRTHAIVAEVSQNRGAMIGGILRELGYEPLVFTSGRDAFAAAVARSDVELIVVHPNIIRWALTETIANFRADSRTANIPIVIHGPAELAPRMQHKAHHLHLVSFSSAVETTNDFDLQLTPLLRRIKSTSMTAQERRAQRVAAAAWLGHIARGRRTKVFNIRSVEPELLDAVNDNELVAHALDCLGEFPSVASQERLAEVALDAQFPAESRQSAALKLAFHIQRFGLLLKQGMIQDLHTAWENPRESADIRTALGSVIGSLKPDDILVGKRLRQQSSKTRP